MNQTVTFKKLPGVLAFKRGHVVSDALMYNQTADGETPVMVIRHGIRGTQNVSDDGKKARDVSNIQITETAKLDSQINQMVVRFNLAFLPLIDSLNACAGKDKTESLDIRNSIESFLERSLKSNGLIEVARRYARNIANGRWLWRNRSLASEIQIDVLAFDSGKKEPQILTSFNAFAIPSNRFEDYSADEVKLADEIAEQMRGHSMKSLIIEAKVTLRVAGAEVFPSQNYIENKPKGFARPLYKVGHAESGDAQDIRIMGQAAIRDQKVFNAIRTIDTWYPAFEEEGLPISIEPMGANLNMQEFYRDKKTSSFELFKRLNQIEPDSAEGMFCIACFDRGGVYSESDQAKDKIEKAPKESGEE